MYTRKLTPMEALGAGLVITLALACHGCASHQGLAFRGCARQLASCGCDRVPRLPRSDCVGRGQRTCYYSRRG